MGSTISTATLVIVVIALCALPFVALLLARRAPQRTRSLAGAIARVVIPVPELGVGAVVHTTGGRPSRLGARHVDGGAIDREAVVVIVEVERGIASVRPIPSDLLEVFR